MKTQQELMQAYWGPGGTVDMVKEYNAKHGCDVKPWECVKYKCSIAGTLCDFSNDKSFYEFALAILYDDKRNEHRPVWEGSELYYLDENVIVKDICNGALTFECGGAASLSSMNMSWNPPTPKRTFKIGDMELPCPLKIESDADNRHCFDTLYRDGHEFYFDFDEDKKQWSKAFTKLLTAARDKE